jgi:ribokinase
VSTATLGGGAGRVVVVGSMNLDHVARVEHLPSAGATVPASSYRTAAGGKGLNQAVAAARQGAPTVMVSAVGADAPGTELLAVLETEGIDRSRVRVVTDAPTGVALIAVGPGGENMLVVAAGANGTVSAGQLDGFEWRPGDVLVCQLEIPLETVDAAIRGARDGGARTLFNPAPATAPLAPSLLAQVDVLVPNEGEALVLAGQLGPLGPPPAAGENPFVAAASAGRALAARSGGMVIVTLGARGSLLCSPSEEPVRVPAHAVHAVDTTAAGDSFCGTLAAALAGGADLPAALRRASVAGSLSTTRHGAVPSIPSASEVDAVLRGS